MISPFFNEAFLVFLGVNILLAWGLYPMVLTGQLSVGQAGFMAVGAYASSWANVELGWPVGLAVPFGIGVTALVAIPVAVGANRIRGIYLIIGTLAVGEIIVVALNTLDFLGGVQGYFGMVGVTLRQVALACLAVLVLLFLLMRSRLGVAMRSIREDEDAAESLGVPTRAIKIAAVVLGAAVTGLAGALQAHYLTFIRPDEFGVHVSFLIALFVLIGGTDNLAGPAVGAFVLTYLPEAFEPLRQYREILYGGFLIAVMIFSPRGLLTREGMGTLARGARMALPRRTRLAAGAEGARISPSPPRGGAERAPGTNSGGPLPVVRLFGIGKRFAGVVALEDVDLDVSRGEIVGLIGPNGAGKTTLVNVATGLLSPTTGRVVLGGEDVTGLAGHRRVERGMARTFQSVRLFPHLSVEENVAVAAHRRGRDPEVRAVLRRLGLENHAADLPGSLPYGLQRKVQMAQALARTPQALFLDEPSIGMNPAELEEVEAVARSVREEGAGVVLVDHNLDLVMGLADRIVVLDFGRKIAEGTPGEVMADPAVQEAYLGMAVGEAPGR